MRPPTKFNKNYQHRVFGIENWLTSKGIANKDSQKQLIDMFLDHKAFIPKYNSTKKMSQCKTSFIQNNFDQFCNFVLKNIEY